MDNKNIFRIKLSLVAKTRQELVQRQLANNIAHDKPFDYGDFIPIYSKGEVIEWLCCYFDTIKPDEKRVIE